MPDCGTRYILTATPGAMPIRYVYAHSARLVRNNIATELILPDAHGTVSESRAAVIRAPTLPRWGRVLRPRPVLDDFSPKQFTSHELREVGDNSAHLRAAFLLGM